MEEFNFLINILNNCAKRPGMYGNPENLETLSKHITHICLTITKSEWTFDATHQLWAEMMGHQLVQPKYETIAHRHQKWGDSEQSARSQIVGVYKKIWQELVQYSYTSHHTRDWVQVLLTYPTLLGSPDNLDTTLGILMGVILKDCYDDYKTLYKQECEQIQGTANRGLLDLGVKTDWLPLPAKFADQQPDYERVTQGIIKVIECLEQIKLDDMVEERELVLA